jgi:hypothetical protein
VQKIAQAGVVGWIGILVIKIDTRVHHVSFVRLVGEAAATIQKTDEKLMTKKQMKKVTDLFEALQKADRPKIRGFFPLIVNEITK